MNIIKKVAKKVVREALGSGKAGGTGASKNDIKLAKLELKKAKIEGKTKKQVMAADKIAGIYEFTKTNCNHFYEIVKKLQQECVALKERIDREKIAGSSGVGFFEKRRILRDVEVAKTIAAKRYSYLYLAYDFFNYLSLFASGIVLTESQSSLIIKFFPFFSGTPVLETGEEDTEDDNNTLWESIKEIGRSIKEEFVPSTQFNFIEHLLTTYPDQLNEYWIPDIDGVFEMFRKTFKEETEKGQVINETVINKLVSELSKSECRFCHQQIKTGSKFCPYCGKTLIMRPAFCAECGKPLMSKSQFCASCGAPVQGFADFSDN